MKEKPAFSETISNNSKRRSLVADFNLLESQKCPDEVFENMRPSDMTKCCEKRLKSN